MFKVEPYWSSIKKGWNNPYCTSAGIYLTKSGADKRKMSPEELKRLFAESGDYLIYVSPKVGTIKAARIGGQYRILGAELLKLFLPEEGYDTARTMYNKSREKIREMEESLKN